MNPPTLTPQERQAWTICQRRLDRDEFPPKNVTRTLVDAVARLTGRGDPTFEELPPDEQAAVTQQDAESVRSELAEEIIASLQDFAADDHWGTLIPKDDAIAEVRRIAREQATTVQPTFPGGGF